MRFPTRWVSQPEMSFWCLELLALCSLLLLPFSRYSFISTLRISGAAMPDASRQPLRDVVAQPQPGLGSPPPSPAVGSWMRHLTSVSSVSSGAKCGQASPRVRRLRERTHGKRQRYSHPETDRLQNDTYESFSLKLLKCQTNVPSLLPRVYLPLNPLARKMCDQTTFSNIMKTAKGGSK